MTISWISTSELTLDKTHAEAHHQRTKPSETGELSGVSSDEEQRAQRQEHAAADQDRPQPEAMKRVRGERGAPTGQPTIIIVSARPATTGER